MTTDPLDKIPQLRQDWSNHVVYGGLAGVSAAATLHVLFGADLPDALRFAFYTVALVSAGKKLYDYFAEHEPWYVCVGKAIVTVLWPASLLFVVS